MYKTKLKALWQGQTIQTVNEVQLENAGTNRNSLRVKWLQLTIRIPIPISLWQWLRITKKYISILACEVYTLLSRPAFSQAYKQAASPETTDFRHSAHQLKYNYQKAEETCIQLIHWKQPHFHTGSQS